MTKVYIVAMPKVTNQDVFFQEYASKVAETLEPFDGKFLAVNPNKLIVEGDEPSVAVIGEFPNKEKHQNGTIQMLTIRQWVTEEKILTLQVHFYFVKV